MWLGFKMLLLIGREQHDHGPVSCGQVGEWEGDTIEAHPVKDTPDRGLVLSAGG